ncbi:MAG TPA: DUF3710 domain-containing protein [Streptosporangiaceae bacterium]|nr:DUF3710 domain-containing protein [Streptosporangiaceae bacterium]
MFRRRRREDADQDQAGYSEADAADGGDWADDEETGDAYDGQEAVAPASGLAGGPWDADDAFPARDRADFGSLLVPITPMQQIELATDGERVIWVSVKSGQSELRVHAFAAPRSTGLWEEVRPEIAAELASVGTTAQETTGPFGTEMFAHVPVQPGNPAAGTVPMRFIGVDGPRWLLRGLIIGAAANGTEPAEPFEQILSDVVVVRGDHPMPPRDMLELRLPAEIQQAIEQQQAAAAAAAQQAGGADGDGEQPSYQVDLNPFERGPEFTETR